MNLHHLYYFQAVAQLRSFTKASEVLFVSQPTLSYAIGCLEKELGSALITRSGRYATLTEDGRLFLDYVNSALADLDKGIAFLRTHANPAAGAVRIYCEHVISTVSVVRAFKKEPGNETIEFSLEHCLRDDIEEQLLLGTYDIGFQTKLPTMSGLDYVQLPNTELVLIVPSWHPLASHDSIDLREVDWNQNVVARDVDVPDSRAYNIASVFQQVGYDINKVSSRASTALGVASLVEAGFGIAVIPNLEHLKDYDVRILSITYPNVESVHFMLRHRRIAQPSVPDQFFNYVAKRYGQTEYIHL